MARLLLQMLFIITTGFRNLDGALLPGLTCNVTEQTDGSIRYQIFGKPSSTGYESSWEKKNGIVIVAITSQYNESVVKSLKNDSVDLYVCEDFLRYNMERFEKDGIHSKLTATCKVNCTHLMTKDSPQVDGEFLVSDMWELPQCQTVPTSGSDVSGSKNEQTCKVKMFMHSLSMGM
ncbi:uncharacterized protein LOC112150866 [Oryzias melastigma]|uniref:uncharacterized protein LOC112150866 n=1 Tax=Oryzias melastigma TaxID=30732 RepID=UPI00168D2395|nr:uncharacterized protein LOC112150866 [Oryzias melastigma]